MKSQRLEIAVTPSMHRRVATQIDLTGENKSEFVRRCIIEKLDALEAKQIEQMLIQQAIEGGASA